MRFPDARILLFAKAPEPGLVKTRLIPRLGRQGAADLYRQLLDRICARLADARLAPVICCCAPDVRHPQFQRMADRLGAEIRQQAAGDLGERMARAAETALEQASAVVLIGGDCPVMTGGYLSRALEFLEQGEDAVIGPASDGGYVLLGLGRSHPRLFEDIPWGGSSVLELTRERLRELGWQWQELAQLWDLDRPEDLDRYRELILAGE